MDRFLIFVPIRCHVTFKLGVFHLWQTNFASYEESPAVPYGAYFYQTNFSVFIVDLRRRFLDAAVNYCTKNRKKN